MAGIRSNPFPLPFAGCPARNSRLLYTHLEDIHVSIGQHPTKKRSYYSLYIIAYSWFSFFVEL